jgi:hypothetical protein
MHILECWPVLQVMEILAHNLETESSLHRRVDLFFLVDSIAQFSRGLKGNLFIALLLLNLVDQKRRKNI